MKRWRCWRWVFCFCVWVTRLQDGLHEAAFGAEIKALSTLNGFCVGDSSVPEAPTQKEMLKHVQATNAKQRILTSAQLKAYATRAKAAAEARAAALLLAQSGEERKEEASGQGKRNQLSLTQLLSAPKVPAPAEPKAEPEPAPKRRKRG